MPCTYFVAILCSILQTFQNELLLLHVNSKFNEFWRITGSRTALLLAKVWEVLRHIKMMANPI